MKKQTVVNCSWTVCVKYLPPSDCRGSRFKAYRADVDAQGKRESITVGFDYAAHNPEDKALDAFVHKFGSKFESLNNQENKWAKCQDASGVFTYSVILS